MFFKKGTV